MLHLDQCTQWREVKDKGIQVANGSTGITMSFRYPIERFSYDIEMKTREQNRNNERTDIIVFFGEKIKGLCFDPFIHWLIKQITYT